MKTKRQKILLLPQVQMRFNDRRISNTPINGKSGLTPSSQLARRQVRIAMRKPSLNSSIQCRNLESRDTNINKVKTDLPTELCQPEKISRNSDLAGNTVSDYRLDTRFALLPDEACPESELKFSNSELIFSMLQLRRQLNERNLEIEKLRCKIRVLQKENNDLRTKNRRISRTLQDEEQTSTDFLLEKAKDLNSLYENVYVTSLTEEIESEKKGHEHTRQRLTELKNTVGDYKRDNFKLRALLKRYKEMSYSRSSKLQSKFSTFIAPSSEEHPESSFIINPIHDCTITGLLEFSNSLPRPSSFVNRISTLFKAFSDLIGCDRVTVYFLSKKEEPHHDLPSNVKYQKIFHINKWIQTYYEANNSILPSIPALEKITSFQRTNEGIILPMKSLSHKNFLLIQLTSKREYSLREEAIAKLLVFLLESRIETELSVNQLDESKQKLSQIIDLLCSIMSAPSQSSLLRSFRQHVAKFHNFEDIGLLFYSASKKQLYTPLEIEESTGLLCDTKSELAFNSEVDHIQSCKEIRNYLFGPLFDSHGHLIGIAQFANVKAGNDISEEDKKLFARVSPLYGLALQKVNEKEKILSTLVALKNVVDTLSQTLSRATDDEFEIMHIGQSLRAATTLLSELMAPRSIPIPVFDSK